MNSLTEKNELLDRAEALNNSLNNNFLALSMVLYEVKETEAYKEAGYEEWVDYYTKHLNREKSAISRLLAAGKFLKERYGGRLPETTISYKLLAASASRNPEADPEYVIAAAATWSEDDFKQDRKEGCPGADLDMTTVSAKCKACKGWHKLPDAPQSPKIGS